MSYNFAPSYHSLHNPFLQTVFPVALFFVIYFYPCHMFQNTSTIHSNQTMRSLLRGYIIHYFRIVISNKVISVLKKVSFCKQKGISMYLDMDRSCTFRSDEHLQHNPCLHVRLLVILLYWKTLYLPRMLQSIQTNRRKMTTCNQLDIVCKID